MLRQLKSWLKHRLAMRQLKEFEMLAEIWGDVNGTWVREGRQYKLFENLKKVGEMIDAMESSEGIHILLRELQRVYRVAVEKDPVIAKSLKGHIHDALRKYVMLVNDRVDETNAKTAKE